VEFILASQEASSRVVRMIFASGYASINSAAKLMAGQSVMPCLLRYFRNRKREGRYIRRKNQELHRSLLWRSASLLSWLRGSYPRCLGVSSCGRRACGRQVISRGVRGHLRVLGCVNFFLGEDENEIVEI
jgi:hypothetical protein